jgi:hypothetical protein
MALLLGRKTWQIHGGAFERMAGDPFADALNENCEWREMSMNPGKSTARKAAASDETAEGFTAEERAAMKERAQEL